MTQIAYQQHFTKSRAWMSRAVKDFMFHSGYDIAVDPFAGGGDLLRHFPHVPRVGYDIDPELGWTVNDGLKSVPQHKNAVCITNPPYLARNSAVRRGNKQAMAWFEANPNADDLYHIALKNCLASYDYVVAIIPESFLVSGRIRNRLVLVDIVERNMFAMTTCPVLIACFGPSTTEDFSVYKNGRHVGLNSVLQAMIPTGNLCGARVTTCKSGQVDFQAVDDIRFELRRESLSPMTRFWTTFSVDGGEINQDFVAHANHLIAKLRSETQDTMLTPFFGNRGGVRRRRMPFSIAKAILHQTALDLSSPMALVA